jgi:hypothetical protein
MSRTLIRKNLPLSLVLSACFAVFGLACPDAACFAAASAPVPASVDLVVYGGTAAGVMTAYSAAQEGLHVVLLEPRGHMGGMVTGGLSATDLGQFKVIGGYARQFYMEAAAHYGVHSLEKRQDWLSEPHVGEAIFNRMLADAKVEVHLHEKLKERGGVKVAGRRIVSITTMDGKKWDAKVFADCSYEGDLMAKAGVKYTVGRESVAQYGEDLAGVRAVTPAHQFTWPLSAYDVEHHLLPEIQAGPMGEPGSGDKKVQTYNFRLILTNDPANRVAFPRPERYDAGEYALLKRYLTEFEAHKGRAPNFHDVTNPVCFANHKCDFNNNGPISTDFIGHSWAYPDGSYAEKDAIWADHLRYTQGFFYFLANDRSVPKTLQAEVNTWGLSKDEFQDTGYWPNQLYIREARRMIGPYVMRQADLQTERTKPDSIGMGSYNSDSHNIQRVARADATVTNEGDVQVPVQPYEIPYRVMTPEAGQMLNLLVPVCFSASHVAYSSVRMEPQYMMIGQAAGVAASLAIRGKVAVQEVPVEALQAELKAHGAYLHLADADAAAAGRKP